MRTVLKQQYPADLFPQLMDTCRGVLVDLANAWPNQLQVPRSNLAMFLNVCVWGGVFGECVWGGGVLGVYG